MSYLLFLVGGCLSSFLLPARFVFNLAVVLVLIFLIAALNKKWRWHLLVLWVCYVVGSVYGGWRLQSSMRQQLLPQHIQTPLVVNGVIDSIPVWQNHHWRFAFLTQTLQRKKMSWQLQLTWYQKRVRLHVGERWQFYVKLKPLHGLHNPGGFNYVTWLRLHHFAATGSVVTDQPQQLIQQRHGYLLERLRQGIANYFLQHIADQHIAHFLVALTVGIRQQLTPDDWQVLQNTGTNHLLAIAGLHIGMLAWLCYGIARWSVWLYAPLVLRMPAQRLALLISLSVAFIYAALAGFAIPTERAFLMLLVLLIAEWSWRQITVTRRLFYAMVIIYMVNPWVLTSASFWLSCASVGFLAYALGIKREAHINAYVKHLKIWFQLQCYLFFGLFACNLFFFQNISLVMMIANAVAIPIVGLLVVPLCLLGVASALWFKSISQLCLWLATFLMQGLWHYLQYLSAWSCGHWQWGLTGLKTFFCLLMASIIMLLPRGIPGRYWCVIWLMPVVLSRSQSLQPNAFSVQVLDVGQGLASVVTTRHHVLVYDTGPKFPGGFDAGQAVLVPYLLSQQIHQVDLLMVSHGDNDHIGGSAAVLKALVVRRILSSVPQRFPSQLTTACQRGQHWQWDGVTFTVLSPEAHQSYLDNDSSCVLRIASPYGSALLTGDIEKPAERNLLKWRAPLMADILVAPHHGSEGSAWPKFIATVDPQYVIFATGFYNRFGFPSVKSQALYRCHDIHCYNTAFTGMVTLIVNHSGVCVQRYVDKLYRWQY